MITREQIVEEARSWIDTPFRHQGRLKGVSVDCAGIVEMVPRALGLYQEICVQPYFPRPDSAAMRAELTRHMDLITMVQLLPGDVLWFRVELYGQHLAIVTEIQPALMMVHAKSWPWKKCVEEKLWKFWRDRIVGCFRYRGID